jgi:putative membrane protein
MFSHSKTLTHILLLLIIIATLIWSAIKPAGYLIWSMEVLPGVILLILVLATYKRFRLTTLSYVIITLLLLFMFVGGHYTYDDVPLFDWVKDEVGLERNHYDRLGHLLKGLFAIVIRELLLRTSPLTRGKWLVTLCVSVMLAIGAMYEIIEWLAAVASEGGKASEDFLGAQGDKWDTQWDMALVFVGSILALLLLSKVHNRFLEKENLNK